MTLACGSRLILLTRTREGYGNLSRTFTLANAADRRNPHLDPRQMPRRTARLMLLTGGRDGPLSALLAEGRHPEAVANSRRIAETCEFDLIADLGYRLPDAEVPQGYTPGSYLQQLCHEAAVRRYGSVTQEVAERLREEFRLIERHNLAELLLLYREIVLLAQQIMEEKGLSHPETPLEECPPGRGVAPRWPCWWATSPASATLTHCAGA